MGRNHTYADSQFGRGDYDPDDDGDYEEGLVCVLMPFDPNFNNVYAAIKSACAELGLRAERADDGVGSGIVLAEITSLIERSEFIVCDLTEERQNVYYELGYAHGVGNEAKEILIIARDGAKLHFNIMPMSARFYKDEADLYSIICKSLSKMIAASR